MQAAMMPRLTSNLRGMLVVGGKGRGWLYGQSPVPIGYTTIWLNVNILGLNWLLEKLTGRVCRYGLKIENSANNAAAPSAV